MNGKANPARERGKQTLGHDQVRDRKLRLWLARQCLDNIAVKPRPQPVHSVRIAPYGATRMSVPQSPGGVPAPSSRFGGDDTVWKMLDFTRDVSSSQLWN